MSLIEVKDLSFTYDSSYMPVFEHVSFRIDTDWKLGIAGRNGIGKTTFLNLLMGKYEYSGKIETDAVFDYFPFAVHDDWEMTLAVLQNMASGAELWRIKKEFAALKLEEDILYRPFAVLSQGEQTKAMLAVLFSRPGHFLLIDEPTNHLDREARALVRDYLNTRTGFLLVSHDRDFLDGCVDHMLSINRTNIEIQRGNFSSWYENKQRKDACEQAEYERLKKDISRLQETALRTRNWADKVEGTKIGKKSRELETNINTRAYIGEKSRRMQQRRKNLERRQQREIEEKSKLRKNVESAEKLRLMPLSYHKERMVFFREVYICYGEKEVCGPVSFEICRGDRISLQGKNGCGKTSILKLVLDSCQGHAEKFAGKRAGTLEAGCGLRISYVPQDTSCLTGSLEHYIEPYGIEDSLFKALLRKFDFSREAFEQPMEHYSEGQKKKVLLARSLCEQAHLYIWDEPLNYIDIYSRMQIEELIKAYRPTLLFVEHDAVFTEKIAAKKVQL